MATSLLANTFLPDPGGMHASLRAPAAIPTKRSPAAPTPDRATTSTPTVPTSGNPPTPVDGQPNQQPSNEFSNTLDKKMRPKTPEKAQGTQKDTNKHTKPELASAAPQAAIGIPVAIDKTAIAADKVNLPQQIPARALDKSAALAAFSPLAKARSVLLTAGKPLTTGPDQPLPDTAQTTDADPADPKLIAPAIAGAKSPTRADAAPTQVSDRPIAPNELPHPAPNEQGEPAAGNIPVAPGKPTPAPQAQVQTPPKALIASLHSTQANQPAADAAATTPAEHALATGVPSPRNNTAPKLPNSPAATAGAQALRSIQNARIRPENSVQNAEYTIPQKAVIGHKAPPDKTQLPDIQQDNTSDAGTASVKSLANKAAHQPGGGSLSSQADNPGTLLPSPDGPANAEAGEQPVVGNTVTVDITHQSPVAGESAKPAADPGSNPSVADQITEPLQTSVTAGSREIVIQLNPPELGKVTITFREDADGITGLLQVNEPQTRHQLQQALPEIIQNLHNSGVHIKKFDVELTDQQQQYNPKDQSANPGQDGWTGRQGSSDFQSQRENTPYAEWLTNNDPVAESAEARLQFADSSINMLA